MSEHPPTDDPPRVRAIAPPEQVPVFNCLVYVLRHDQGAYLARSATLDGVSGGGDSEREALKNVVQAFKTKVGGYLADEKPIPWLEVPLEAAPDEQSRWIAVHL